MLLLKWKSFCHAHKIAITDLITSIDDASEEDETHLKSLGGYSDSAIAKGFKNFKDTDVVSILLQYPGISNVYFTRVGDSFGKNYGIRLKNIVIHTIEGILHY